MSDNKPMLRPGSPEAQKQGCTCPVMDNQYGRGYRYLEVAKVRMYVVDGKRGIGSQKPPEWPE